MLEFRKHFFGARTLTDVVVLETKLRLPYNFKDALCLPREEGKGSYYKSMGICSGVYPQSWTVANLQMISINMFYISKFFLLFSQSSFANAL